jgi:Acyl-coenzyme A synthetases/AMP-(fatty) acid ligases
VHVQGGFLVSIAREAAYQADAHEGDVMLFATDMGWIMGPWTLVGMGALGGTIVFLEGAPDWPTPFRLVGDGRARARHVPRTLADSRARVDPARRPVE